MILALLLGAIGILFVAIIGGKILGYSPYTSAAIGICCMFGYPGTQIITDEVINNLNCSEEMKMAVRDNLMPKMLVSGFVSVTIASVAFASIIIPLVF